MANHLHTVLLHIISYSVWIELWSYQANKLCEDGTNKITDEKNKKMVSLKNKISGFIDRKLSCFIDKEIQKFKESKEMFDRSAEDET
jgi:hypothetical protein